MRVIASANQKGGCGKTTTAINLSSSLSLKGQKVLLIDFDPQAHATMGLNIKSADLEKSIYDVVTPKKNGSLGIEDISIPVRDNFDLAPSSIILSAFEQELSGLEGREDRLLQAIQPLEGKYDYIVIDCPPSIGHLSFNALRVADEVIIPIDMSLFSLRGVSKLVEMTLLLKDKVGHEARSRALITMYDRRTRYSRIVLEKVKAEFGSNVFETVIRYNIRLRETADYGLPVGDYDKHSIGHEDYENLAEEVLRSDAAQMYDQRDTLNAVKDIMQNTEEYIETVAELPADEPPASEMQEFSGNESHDSETEAFSEDESPDFEKEEFPAYSSQSNYSQMIEAIAADSRDSFLKDKDEI
ncbi:MAG: ParA family protein [Desulfobacterales bacterium]